MFFLKKLKKLKKNIFFPTPCSTIINIFNTLFINDNLCNNTHPTHFVNQAQVTRSDKQPTRHRKESTDEQKRVQLPQRR